MKKRKLIIPGIGLILLVSMLVCLGIGSVHVPVKVTLSMLLNRFLGQNRQPLWTATQETIILTLRLPRVFLAMVVGAMLATAGTAFQGVLRNPLADPYILGISSGAAAGAAGAILLVDSIGALQAKITLPLLAFGGAILSLLMVFALAWRRNRDTVSLILAGVVVQSFLGAALSFAVTIAGSKLRTIVFWMMGSLSAASWGDVLFLSPYLIICYLLIYSFYRNLNILSLGEQAARHLGMNVERIKTLVLLAGSLLAAAAVSVVGIIGFIGLIVPHIIRLFTGPDHRLLLPSSALAGALFLLWSDTIARSLIPTMEIPIGVITALAGAPFFGYLLKKKV